jgi:cellulose synthase/poly-beta-1,6-N-acetylglucosamine synthase-like glycosyltransferase
MQGSARDRLAHGRATLGDTIAPQRRAGQTAQAGAQHGPPSGQYAFLLQAGVSAATLAIAEAEARRCGVPVHQVLLCAGFVSQTAYTSALAWQLGVPVAGWEAAFHLEALGDADNVKAQGAPAHLGGRPYRVLCAEEETPDVLRERLASLRALGFSVALSTRFRLDAALDAHLQPARLDQAISGLARQQPACSAAGPIWIWQIIASAVAVGLIAGGFSVLPYATLGAVSGVIALPFLCVTLLRVIALREIIASPRKAVPRQLPAALIAPQTLPLYTVMVPLFREVKVLPGLLQSLQAIIYPRAKLEILLVLEAVDIETQAAVLAMALPGNIRTVVVPDQAPRTKPKALNYALQFARGQYVVVYDAEDRPEPDQLLRALTAFERGPPDLGCVQAQLNIYNPRASWLTRHFTIEYSALFDAILPALARLGLPVPLGGTSNHFRRDTLIATGGWDPFNVTEDADLGFRMARRGWRTAILASTTWEEAPVTIGQWIKQRTRWLKGWMQTYLVHTRRPWRLNAELGMRGALGFHALMGALILSALVHPLFYILLACHAVLGELLTPSDTIAGTIFWTVACINLAGGYVASILVGALSVWRRGRRGLALSAVFMPVIWLLMSAAAYRALYQLARDPYLWEKTEHGVDQV